MNTKYSSYLNDKEQKILKTRKKTLKIGRKSVLVSSFLVVAIIATIFGGILAAFGEKPQQEAKAWDPVQYIFCSFDEGSMPRAIYEGTQTNAMEFALFSKSPVTGSGLAVDSGLNAILSISGMDFNKANEMVLGRALPEAGQSFQDEDYVEPTPEEREANFNKGPRVSVFDRFGMAGTSFTTYNGEWRYLIVDACSDSKITDLRLGEVYDERLIPRSTWEDRESSQDPRTMQHFNGPNAQFWKGFVNLVANVIFWITKLLVTITIAFVNFSFTDITAMFGVDDILAGGKDGDGGIFHNLYENLYLPFIWIIMSLAGLRLLYVGAVKKQFRDALSKLLVSVLLFIGAIIMFAAPGFFVKIPNAVAVSVQSVIVNAMSSGLSGGGGLCTTNVGSQNVEIVNGAAKLKDQDLLTSAAQNMHSAIGCQFWYTFVFIPWVEGQWGTEFNELWANDFAPNGGSSLGNANGDWVGDAGVAVGEDTFINNWAVYQVSTQTEAHAPFGEPGELTKVTNNVANDWWRIVDAVSNYNEKVATNETINNKGDTSEIEYTVPDTSKGVTPYWDTWAGNNPGARIGAAFTSVFVGGIGLIGPMLFSFLAVMYSLALSIVMVFAPVIFLLGSLGNKGFQIFKDWALLLASLTVKRIVTAVLLMLSIVLTNVAIGMMTSIGWWTGIAMMALLTVVLIMTRGKIMDAISSLGLTPGALASTAQRIGGKINSTGKTVGKIAGSATSGAMQSKMKGGRVWEGLKAGVGTELNTLSYRSQFAAATRRELEGGKLERGDATVEEITQGQICRICMKKLSEDSEEGIMLGSDGNYIHKRCYYDNEDMVATEFPDEEFREVNLENVGASNVSDSDFAASRTDKEAKINENYAKTMKVLEENLTNRNDAGELGEGMIEDRAARLKIAKDTIMHEVMPEIKDAIKRYRDSSDHRVLEISVPDDLRGIISQDMVNAAMRSGDYKWVESAFAAAYVTKIQNNYDIAFEELPQLIDEVFVELQRTGDNREADERFDQSNSEAWAKKRDEIQRNERRQEYRKGKFRGNNRERLGSETDPSPE